MTPFLDGLLGSDVRRTAEELLAIGAIALAWVHALHLRKQVNRVNTIRDDLNELRSTLTEVRNALPTKNLGEFPRYLSDIVDLIRQAKRSVTIFCDFPAYGTFSDPENFLKYRHAIEDRASHGVAISIACLATNLRVRKTKEELAKENWERWRVDEHSLPKIEKLLTRHARSSKPEHVTVDEIVQLLGLEDKAALDHTFASSDRVLLHEAIPLYFWLVDDMYAVFSIPSYHGRATEHGFYTQDPRLVQGLRDIHDRYFNRSHNGATVGELSSST
jgi:hypothetical protein